MLNIAPTGANHRNTTPDAGRRALIMQIIQHEVRALLTREEIVTRLIAAAKAHFSFRLVAQIELPESYDRNEDAATNIVAGVLQEKLDPADYAAIAERNQTEGVKRGLAKGRQVAGIIEWPEAEYTRMIEIAPLYLHAKGRQKGKPDCTILAGLLNAEFHSSQPVRTAGAVAKMLCQAYKDGLTIENNDQVEIVEWSADEDAAFEHLMTTFVHPAGHQHEGRPDYALIALELNSQFYAEQLEEGVEVRTANTCNRHARIIRQRIKKRAGESDEDTVIDAA